MNITSKAIEALKQFSSQDNEKSLFNYCSENYLNKLTPYRLYAYASKLCAYKLQDGGRGPLDTKAKISVITVNFNNKVGLIKTVVSVLNQTSPENIQFIVVDGNSTDGSLDYLREVERNIDISVYGKDSGVYDAMNRGISLAESDYTIFMNSGDCFDSPTVVEEVLKIAENQGKPDFIYGAARLEYDNIWQPSVPENIWKGMICSHQSAFFNTKLINKLGGYSLNNAVVSDYQLIAKLFSLKASFLRIGIVISEIEPVGISSDFSTRTIERWKVIRELSIESVTPEIIDNFYRDLLSTRGAWVAAHSHVINKSQAKLISNVEKRVCFLISMPRSGSTLLQRIIDQSNDIATAGEPWFMLPLTSMYDSELVDAKYGQDLNIMAKDEFINDTGLIEVINNAQKVYADSIYSSAVKKYGKRFFLDKTPRYVHIIDKLSKIYPNAKFVLLKRNPAAVISSYATTWYENDYEKMVVDRYAKYDLEDGFLKLGEFCESKFANKIVINYEDLVSSPEDTAAKIFKYLGLKFDKNFVNYNQGKGIVKYTFGDPSTVYSKSRPDPSFNDKWIKSLIDHKHAKTFLSTLDLVPKKAFKLLGYDYDHIKSQVTNKFNLVLPQLVSLSTEFGREKKAEKYSHGSLGVLITCFNNEFTIRDSIESVINQSKKAELIVVADDVSTDNSTNIIKSIINEYSDHNIQLIERTANVGVSKNRDEAIRAMDVDYVTTLDGDDMFYPGKLAAEYAEFKQDNVAVSYSDIVVLGEDNNVLISTKLYSNINKHTMLDMLCGRKAPVPRDMMFRKTLFEKASGFDVDMEIYEDWAFKMRLISVLEDGQCWQYSGVIGTVYDRRNPGLSEREPIMHAYGQLLALARNARIIDNNAMASGLETVAQSLSSSVKTRLLKFAKTLRKQKAYESYRKIIISFWETRNWQLTSKVINEIIWELSSLDISPLKIVVCTPVYNAVETIERTIKSVLDQVGDFELHYHIQDGGSNDGTLKVIEDWKSRIVSGTVKLGCKKFTFTFESKKDNGMYHALTKGIKSVSKKTSDWITWINADDYFVPDAFKSVVDCSKNPEISWLNGMVSVRELDGTFNRCFRPMNRAIIRKGLADGIHWDYVQQEGTFFKASLWNQINQNKFASFNYAGDWYLWKELADISEIYLYRKVLANFCKVEGQLSQVNKDKYEAELDSIISKSNREKSFQNFPVSEGQMYVLEDKENQVGIVKGSVLGQFTTKFQIG